VGAADHDARPGLGEAVVLWGLYAVDLALIAAAPRRRRDPASGVGAPSARRRVAAFVAHPLAPAAVPLGLLAACRAAPDRGGRFGGATLALGMALPGVARRTLGRRERGVGPALGATAAALALTAAAIYRAGVGGFAPRRRGDGVRLALGGGLAVAALAWLLADLGVYAGDVLGLRRVFLSRQRLPPGARGPAVHLGHHHGLDGALLAWTGLALSRQVPAVPTRPARDGLGLLLSGMTLYGLARAAEDAWYEQVVKRGWTRRRLPRLVADGRPESPGAWAALLGLSVAVRFVTARADAAADGPRRTAGVGPARRQRVAANSGTGRSSPKKWRRAASSATRPSGPKA
jgi:hypothetical protein